MRRERVADAGRDLGRTEALCGAGSRRLQQVLGQGRGAGRVAHVGQHQEFVAAEAADRILLPYRLLQRLRKRHQQRIAGGVTVDVVERLEAIEVDEEQRHWP